MSSLSPWALTSGSPRVTPEGLLGASLGHLTHARLPGPRTPAWSGPRLHPQSHRGSGVETNPTRPTSPSPARLSAGRPSRGRGRPEHGARPGRKAPRLSAGCELEVRARQGPGKVRTAGVTGAGQGEGSGRGRQPVRSPLAPLRHQEHEGEGEQEEGCTSTPSIAPKLPQTSPHSWGGESLQTAQRQRQRNLGVGTGVSNWCPIPQLLLSLRALPRKTEHLLDGSPRR